MLEERLLAVPRAAVANACSSAWYRLCGSCGTDFTKE